MILDKVVIQEVKENFSVRPISKESCFELVEKYHYSNADIDKLSTLNNPENLMKVFWSITKNARIYLQTRKR